MGPEPGVHAAWAPTPGGAGSSLYWRLRSVRDPEDQAALENICRAVAEQLDHVGWPVTRAGSGRNVSALWASVASGAPCGRVELLPGHEPGVAFLLLVARRCARVRVANEDQQVVTDWPQELPVSDQILETLGLKSVSTESLLASMAGEAWFY